MSIPVSLYEKLEQKFGRDEALEIAKMIEDFFDEMDRKAGEIALQKKLELKDELTRELATKADLITARAERGVEGEIKNVRTELEGKIEKVRIELGARIDRLDLKLNLLILLVVIVLTVMNPVVAELLKKWFGIH
jgi:predicted ribosome quality control (RQC) complex YloA/Tae2 family protein